MGILDEAHKRSTDRRFREAERELDRLERQQTLREQLDARRRELEDRRAFNDKLNERTSKPRALEDQPEDPRWSAVVALVCSAILTVLVLAALVRLLVYLNESGNNGPESALSLVFVAAAVVLILVVCTLTIVLKRLRLTNRDEAMGLPRGSIRAVIALLLILLFFIAAIFLFNSTSQLNGDRTENRELNDIDAARFGAIPTELIQSVSQETVDGEVLYDVVLYPNSNGTPTSDDLAKQLVTVLGTLVTAVAAFYFGANSVHDAKVSEAQLSGGTGDQRVGPGAPGVGGPDAAARAAAAAAAAAAAVAHAAPAPTGQALTAPAGPGHAVEADSADHSGRAEESTDVGDLHDSDGDNDAAADADDQEEEAQSSTLAAPDEAATPVEELPAMNQATSDVEPSPAETADESAPDRPETPLDPAPGDPASADPPAGDTAADEEPVAKPGTPDEPPPTRPSGPPAQDG